MYAIFTTVPSAERRDYSTLARPPPISSGTDGQECPSSSRQAHHFCLVFDFGGPPFAARFFKTEFFCIFFRKWGNFEAGLRAPPVFERLMVQCPLLNG